MRINLNMISATRLLLTCLIVIAIPVAAQGEEGVSKFVIVDTAILSHVDESMYRAFWDDLPDDMPRQTIIREVEIQKLLGLRYNQETWRSAKLSAQKGKVIQTKELDLLAKLMAKIAGDPAEHERVQGVTTRLIQAAATKQAYKAGEQTFHITEDMAEESLQRISASIERAEILLGDQWPPEPKERVLKSLGVKVQWAYPFAETQSTSEIGSGVTIKTSQARCVMDENSVVALHRDRLATVPRDPEDTWRLLHISVSGTAKDTGGTVVSTERDTLAGMPCLAAMIKVQGPDGDQFLAVKYAIEAERRYLYSCGGMSTTMPKAEELRDSVSLNFEVVNDP